MRSPSAVGSPGVGCDLKPASPDLVGHRVDLTLRNPKLDLTRQHYTL